ncbi:MAG TPA: LysM peptidoglycan-binding domain-containing protein, partial [Flavobacterium sp.]|nr:LysM peptidoglycan-binding domain-containing protein [Flavobacterium sp.]
VFASNEAKIYAYVQHELDFKNTSPYKTTTTAVATVEKPAFPIGSITQYYKVKQGDNLSSIANLYNVEISELKKWNKLSSNTVSYGKVLTIIAPEIETNTAVASTNSKANKVEKIKKDIKADSLISNSKTNYIVQKGDNLSDIAEENNVTVAQIKEWNNLSGNTIQAGTSLQVSNKEIETKEAIAATPELKNIEYTVQRGDNLGSISKKFGTAVTDLKEWNHLSDNNIAFGKTLIVAKNEVAINTSKASVASFKKNNNASNHDYLVQKGDSLFSIAKKYSGVSVADIKKWNNINNEDIKPGMKLKIGG